MSAGVRLYLPFEKGAIDESRRIVWGVASTEEPDLQGDIMPYEASKRAFSRWHKNCREMHGDNAIGKAVRIMFDSKARLVRVGVYVSKGAEDTWLKVKEGVLKGFSIGGYPLRSTPCRGANGRSLRRVDDYVLEELSLVDTPANPACRVTAITKRGSILVATDVLGRLPTIWRASDVITHEVPPMPQTKRTKVKSLIAFTKSLTSAKPEDELLVVAKSAFTRNAAGELVLKSDAPCAPFTKGELDGDGYDNDSDEAVGDDEPSDVDFAEHAGNAARMHHDLVKAAGLGDPMEHYEAANAEDDSAAGNKDMSESGAPIGKSATQRHRHERLQKREERREAARDQAIKSEIRSAVADMATAFTAQLEEFKKSLGGPAQRQGGTGDGEVLRKGADGVTAIGPTGDSPDYADRLKKAYDRRDRVNSGELKLEAGERMALAREIASLEVRALPAEAAR